jgi:hypothetical protein
LSVPARPFHTVHPFGAQAAVTARTCSASRRTGDASMAARTASALGAGAVLVALATAVSTMEASRALTARVLSRSNRLGSSPSLRSSVRSGPVSNRRVKSAISVGDSPNPTAQRTAAGEMVSR